MATKKKTTRKPANGKDDPVKITKCTQYLKVKLTDAELKEAAERSAELVGQLDALDKKIDQIASEKKAETDSVKADLTQARAELTKLSQWQRERAKYADVDCEVRHIYRTTTVETVRLDTKEVVSERPMSAEELQVAPDGLDGGGKKDGAKAAESKPAAEATAP